VLVPQTDADGEITSIKVNYVESFVGQMLYYSDMYNFLPEVN
jgi:dipeptidyl-peptidase-3